MLRSLIRSLVFGCALAYSVGAFAVLDFTIEGVEKALPIAVVPFGWEAPGAPPVDIASVIASDLTRSGRFGPMPFSEMSSNPTEFSAVNFRDWRLLGMDNLVIGKLLPKSDGSFEIEFRLIDVVRGKQLAGYRVPARAANLRYAAHQIADIIYEKLLGESGSFATRIAYVTVDKTAAGRVFRLQLSDSDGYGARTLVKSREPIMSPAWSADGRRIAYVSFDSKNSAIYVQDVATGERRRVSAGEGINSAPAFSPDGTRLAMTLSKDGNPEIYLMELASGRLTRMTNNLAIDTEPQFMPDGRSLIFTSDRAGGPQIYRLSLVDGAIERVTLNMGRYNARGRLSPDGRRLAMVHARDGKYQIALLDLITREFRVLTESRLDESPSFAPNGSMIIYTTVGRKGTELAAVSADGRVRQRLTQAGGEVREPVWGPLVR